ncbi:MAG: glycosyltransferase [Nanoarchaeota archaeon]
MLNEKDICVLIPTYNRPDDIEKTANSLVKDGKPAKLIILDQSVNEKTKKLISKISKNNKFVEYRHYNIRGKNIVLNYVIDELKKKYKLFFLIDDDVDVVKGFFKSVLNEFNNNEKTKGVGAVDLKDFERGKNINYKSLKFKLKRIILEFMLLPHQENHKFKMLGPYGNTGTPKIEKDIRDCQWIPGFVMCYRNEVFENYRIPDRIGYDVSEDIDLSYYVYKKYGVGSLVIPLNVKVFHNYSQVERYADKKRIFVNHEDHFNFYYRQFYNFFGTIKFLWELFWINILNAGRVVIKPNKNNLLKLKYLWEALSYCIKYKKEIKKGESRMFLNPDLSFKEKYKA